MDTIARLKKVFLAVFGEEVDEAKLTLEASLREDMGINSIGLLYMAMAAEEEFGIKFKNEDFAAIRTVGDVVALIESK